jgi:hypothetical protein
MTLTVMAVNAPKMTDIFVPGPQRYAIQRTGKFQKSWLN